MEIYEIMQKHRCIHAETNVTDNKTTISCVFLDFVLIMEHGEESKKPVRIKKTWTIFEKMEAVK